MITVCIGGVDQFHQFLAKPMLNKTCQHKFIKKSHGLINACGKKSTEWSELFIINIVPYMRSWERFWPVLIIFGSEFGLTDQIRLKLVKRSDNMLITFWSELNISSSHISYSCNLARSKALQKLLLKNVAKQFNLINLNEIFICYINLFKAKLNKWDRLGKRQTKGVKSQIHSGQMKIIICTICGLW